MRLPLVNCPVCNALERLSRKEKRVGDHIYAYTRCGTCRTVFPLETFSVEEQRIKQKSERQLRRQIRRGGGQLRSSRAHPR